MLISDSGIELIKHFEGFMSHPYLDVAMVPTIGYGTTHYHHRAVKLDDQDISERTATYLLRTQVDETYGKAVNHYVQVPLTQNQFDALVSFTYNLGVGAFKSSTLLRDINHGKIAEAYSEFHKWTHANGKVNRGLIARRKKEAELFLA